MEEQAAKLQLTENQLMTQNKVQDELRFDPPPTLHRLCSLLCYYFHVSCVYFLLVSGRDERDESNRQMGELRERLQARENDNARELKRREKTQKELQDVRSKFDEEMKVEEQVRYITTIQSCSLPTFLAK